MRFGQVIDAMKGEYENHRRTRFTRTGWNGKGMWIRAINLYADPEFSVREHEPCDGTWVPFLVMKTVDNKLVPWLASQTDILAEDWEVVL